MGVKGMQATFSGYIKKRSSSSHGTILCLLIIFNPISEAEQQWPSAASQRPFMLAERDGFWCVEMVLAILGGCS